MSRIILTKYDNGDDHIVIGYDRPLQTYYWQEFAEEPRMFYSEERGKWMVGERAYDTKVEAQDHQYDDWEEMIDFAGYDMGELPDVDNLFRHAMTHNERVAIAMADLTDQGSLVPMLKEHKNLPYPASNTVVDMSKRDL